MDTREGNSSCHKCTSLLTICNTENNIQQRKWENWQDQTRFKEELGKPQQQGLPSDFLKPIPHKDLPCPTSTQQQHLQNSYVLQGLIPPTVVAPNAAEKHISHSWTQNTEDFNPLEN